MMKKIKYLFSFPIDIWQMFITYLPGPAGYYLRNMFWRKRLKRLGDRSKIDIGVYFQNPENISIGDYCWIDRGVIIMAGADQSDRPRKYISNSNFSLEKGMVFIGDYVHIAPYSILSGIGGLYIKGICGIASGSKIFSFTNHYRSNQNLSDKDVCFALFVPPEKQYMIEGPVFIDTNVGLASNVTILPGSSIGKFSFVAINSVLSGSFPANSLISGNPAKRIKDRFKSEDCTLGQE